MIVGSPKILASFGWFLICLLGTFSCLHAQTEADSTTYYYNRVLDPQSTSDLPDAYAYFTKEVDGFLEQKDTLQAVKGLQVISQIELDLGFLQDSEETSTEALQLLDRMALTPKVRLAKGEVYSHLGRLYRRLRDESMSIHYYDEALRFAKNHEDSLEVEFHKSVTYIIMGDYTLAKNLLRPYFEQRDQLADPKTQAQLYDRMGYAESQLGEAIGLEHLENGLAIRKEIGDWEGAYFSNKHLYEYYLKVQDTAMAIKHAHESFKISQDLYSPTLREEALTRLMLLHPAKMVSEYVQMMDSTQMAQRLMRNRFASVKYNFHREKHRADEMASANEKERQKRIVLHGLTIALVLIGVFVYLLLQSHHQKDNLRKVYEAEAEMSQRIHDEVANDLYQLTAQIEHSEEISKQRLLHSLDAIYKKSRDISREHPFIDSEEPFKETLLGLLQSFRSQEVTIITKGIHEVAWDDLSDIKKNTLYRVVQELLVNMKKHSAASTVVLSFKQKHQKIKINYSDNGLGASHIEKNGLKNAENRMHAIHGTLTFESSPNKGFKVKLTV